MASGATESHLADEVLDELLPEGVDWRHLVSRYPRSCLLVAAAGGFWLAWKRGDPIVSAVGAFAATQVGDAVKHHLAE